MEKPDSFVMFYFLSYCKAKMKGWDEFAEYMLNALHDRGFDMKEINGKWCLVKKDDENGK